MNAQYRGKWDVAPRGHPNDGRLDVLDADLPLDERLQVRGRLKTGTHLPHPRIESRHVEAVQIDLATPTPGWPDGERREAPARSLSLRPTTDAPLSGDGVCAPEHQPPHPGASRFAQGRAGETER